MGLGTPWNKEWVIETCHNEWAIVNIIWVFQNNIRLPDIEHPR